MKSLTKVSTLASVISSLMLLVAASGLGFSSLIPTAVASPVVDGGGDTSTTTTMSDNASSLNATTPITPTIELGEEPFAIGRYSPVSETVLNETQQIQIALEGSTTITLPNTTETITTRDRGEGIITFLPGGGVIRGQIQLTTEDGSESATADLTEYFLDEAPTAISIVYFSTNSTGILAPLNQMIAVSLDEEQPNGDVVARLFEWKRGDGGSSGGNDTTTTMTTTTESPAVIPIP